MHLMARNYQLSLFASLLVVFFGLFNSCASSDNPEESDVEATAEGAEGESTDEAMESESETDADESVTVEEPASEEISEEVVVNEVQPAEPVAEETSTEDSMQTYQMETSNVPTTPVEQSEVATVSEPYPETTVEPLISEKIESDSYNNDMYSAPQPVVKESKKKSRSSSFDTASAPSNHGEYVIVPGDTLGSVASKIYGSRKSWKRLADSSNISNPNKIFPGDVIYFEKTGKGKTFAEQYKKMPRATVKVSRGDTLASISTRVFGNKGLWKVLWKYNQRKIKNPNHIFVGMTLSYIELNGHKAKQTAKAAPAKAKKAPVVQAAKQAAPVEVAPAAPAAQPEQAVVNPPVVSNDPATADDSATAPSESH